MNFAGDEGKVWFKMNGNRYEWKVLVIQIMNHQGWITMRAGWKSAGACFRGRMVCQVQ